VLEPLFLHVDDVDSGYNSLKPRIIAEVLNAGKSYIIYVISVSTTHKGMRFKVIIIKFNFRGIIKKK